MSVTVNQRRDFCFVFGADRVPVRSLRVFRCCPPPLLEDVIEARAHQAWRLELGVICEPCDHVGEDGVDEEHEDE